MKNDFRLGLASRYPIRANEMLNRHELMDELISLDDFRRYELDVDGETLHFANLHLQSPRFGLRAVIAHPWGGGAELDQYTKMRRLEAAAIHDWLAPYPAVVIAGDFNTPLESPTFRHNFGGYLEAFSAAGWGVGNTFQPGLVERPADRSHPGRRRAGGAGGVGLAPTSAPNTGPCWRSWPASRPQPNVAAHSLQRIRAGVNHAFVTVSHYKISRGFNSLWVDASKRAATPDDDPPCHCRRRRGDRSRPRRGVANCLSRDSARRFSRSPLER